MIMLASLKAFYIRRQRPRKHNLYPDPTSWTTSYDYLSALQRWVIYSTYGWRVILLLMRPFTAWMSWLGLTCPTLSWMGATQKPVSPQLWPCEPLGRCLWHGTSWHSMCLSSNCCGVQKRCLHWTVFHDCEISDVGVTVKMHLAENFARPEVCVAKNRPHLILSEGFGSLKISAEAFFVFRWHFRRHLLLDK